MTNASILSCQGLKECFFGDNTLPEPLSHLLWEGAEEYDVDEAGRMVSVYSRAGCPSSGTPHQHQPDLPASAGASPGVAATGRKVSLAAAATVAANPFAGFSRRKRGAAAAGAGGGGTAAAATPMNPFAPAAAAAAPPTTTAAAAAAAPTGRKHGASSSPSLNPFASPEPAPKTAAQAIETTAPPPPAAEAAAGSGVARDRVGVHVNEREVRGFSDLTESGDFETTNDASTSPSSWRLNAGGDGYGSSPPPLSLPEGADGSPDIDLSRRGSSSAHEGTGEVEGERGGAEETEAAPDDSRSSRSSSTGCGSGSPSFSYSFDGEVFRDAGRLFGPHLRGKAYSFGRQRVEVVLRKPGGLRLGIWRPPLDEREEKEREKEKGKAASEVMTVEQLRQQRRRLEDR